MKDAHLNNPHHQLLSHVPLLGLLLQIREPGSQTAISTFLLLEVIIKKFTLSHEAVKFSLQSFPVPAHRRIDEERKSHGSVRLQQTLYRPGQTLWRRCRP